MKSELDEEKKEQEKRLRENLSMIKNKILVLSGKGGVGKTTVAVNIGYGLALRGFETGVLDIDIHGPNVAKMLGIEGRKLYGSGASIDPVQVVPHLKAMSIALLMDSQDQPVIWRGPLKMSAIKQFISDVNWGELDYMVIDSPPGTGDEPLSICQIIPDVDGAVVVTTPQDVAILDSRKSVMFTRELNVPVVGIIENMSGFVCPHCGGEIDLFGSGGGERAAKGLDVPFLGKIPIDPCIVKRGDEGTPLIEQNPDSAAGKMLNSMIDRIIKSLEEHKNGMEGNDV